jgi:isopenicillin N synthase-like dioxygenase
MDHVVEQKKAGAAPPIVSLAGMRSRNQAARLAVGSAFRSACLDKGFLYIVDHGVAPGLIEAMFTQTKRFFDLPMQRKLAVDMAQSACHRGYEKLRAQVLEAGAPPDLKEGFYIGNHLTEDDPRVIAGLFNHGPNIWPENLPGWQETMETYFAQMCDLCRLTMRALALSLDLPEDHFEAFCDEPQANLRLLHYPPQPANSQPGEKGCGAHTDFGALTYLMQDDVGGLQVWDAQFGWVEAPPIPGAYLLNLGDLIARWTNQRYRSTLHRVINRSGRERYSIPFFFTGRPDYVVACLPGCLAPGEQPKYAPTTANGHLREMYDLTYKTRSA